ncbi:disease resistance protein [Striga asiatica]|uniref:Disease resistance protein n=1 Tax=Striga asiatica TaxID=4170 RepID=A0A5A7R7T9_STRAF|nr:disease resistance protein [Striga asiatica]
MAAYAALLSLTKTIDQIQNHPRPPISLDKPQIEPLIEKAEDIIESHIADHIEALAKANITSNNGSLYRYLQKQIRKMTLCINNNKSLNKDDSHQNLQKVMQDSNSITKDDLLYRNLQKVRHDLDSITKDVAAVKDKVGKKITPSTEDDAMLGSDDVMNDIMDKLNGPSNSAGDDSFMNDVMDKLINQQSSRWIIAIAGMGGIGKTTLAKRIYEHPLVVEQFDIRRWATVSQEFDSKRILVEVLDCLTMGNEDSECEYEELGQKLYQSLYGRRYLIVMDDIWSMEAWDGVKRFFPNNNDGSKVLITTRLSNVALQLDGPDYIQMRFLNQDESWNLLRRCVFHEQECPPELEEIGKEIARNCRGLPLSIVVIGGFLAKSEQKHENWKHILDNLSPIVNLEKDEHSFRILKLSYNQLPVHLKPCFLYMGMFPEDHRIHVPTLLKLWVAEGFVKQVGGKSLGTIAREVYLHGLVIRNLIMVREWGPTRRIKRCGIHDLLRDLCIKEAEKYKLFRTMETTTHNNTDHHDQISWRAQRRIGIHQAGKYIRLPNFVQSASRARTLMWKGNGRLPSVDPFRLLRILNAFTCGPRYYGKELFLPVNLCHLVAPGIQFRVEVFYRLWNLQTLIVGKSVNLSVLDIWRMPQLRHVKVYCLQLTDPPPPPPPPPQLRHVKLYCLQLTNPPPPPPLMGKFENGDGMVLEKLETLKEVLNLRLSEEVVERIPNIKKLGLWLGWEEMGTKIGSLPYLEALNLYYYSFVGPEWETAEGGFHSLKYLTIVGCSDLEQWRAEAAHFPRLEQLDLEKLDKLKEIPLEIGDIPTLREIIVVGCADSLVLSANKILEEQDKCLGEVGLKIHVLLNNQNKLRKEKLSSSPNITVHSF